MRKTGLALIVASGLLGVISHVQAQEPRVAKSLLVPG